MSGVAFLLMAVGLSLFGSLVIWLLSRKPTRWDSGIEDFSRHLHALSPENREPGQSVRRRARSRPQDRG